MEGLDPQEIALQISEDIRGGGCSLSTWYDIASWSDGMQLHYTPVDRAVVTFVGTREQVARVAQIAHEIVAEAKNGR